MNGVLSRSTSAKLPGLAVGISIVDVDEQSECFTGPAWQEKIREADIRGLTSTGVVRPDVSC